MGGLPRLSRYCNCYLMPRSFCFVFGQTIRENLFAFIALQLLLLVGVKYDSRQQELEIGRCTVSRTDSPVRQTADEYMYFSAERAIRAFCKFDFFAAILGVDLLLLLAAIKCACSCPCHAHCLSFVNALFLRPDQI